MTGNLKLPSAFFIDSRRSAACAGDTLDLPVSPIANIFSNSVIISLETLPSPRTARFGQTVQLLSNRAGMEISSASADRRPTSGWPMLFSSILFIPIKIIRRRLGKSWNEIIYISNLALMLAELKIWISFFCICVYELYDMSYYNPCTRRSLIFVQYQLLQNNLRANKSNNTCRS